VRRYFRVIEAHRGTFWDEIHALPGEQHLQADLPIAEHDN
jgi:hypothetical protein